MKVLKRNPLLVDADNNLGNALAAEKHWDGAVAGFEQTCHFEALIADAYTLGKFWKAAMNSVPCDEEV